MFISSKWNGVEEILELAVTRYFTDTGEKWTEILSADLTTALKARHNMKSTKNSFIIIQRCPDRGHDGSKACPLGVKERYLHIVSYAWDVVVLVLQLSFLSDHSSLQILFDQATLHGRTMYQRSCHMEILKQTWHTGSSIWKCSWSWRNCLNHVGIDSTCSVAL